MSTPTVSKDFAEAVLDYLSQQGIDEQQVLSKLRLSSTSQMLINNRIPLNHYERLYDVAEQLTGDPYIGLHVGATPLPKSWGLVSYLAMSASNAMMAIKAFMQYSMLQLDLGHLTLEDVDDESVAITWKLDTPRDPNRHVIEHLYANIMVLAESQVGFPFSERIISFKHSAIDKANEVGKILSAKILFDQPEYKTLLPRDALETESVQAQETLHQAAIGLAKEQLMALRNDDKLINTVHSIIIERLPFGLPKLHDIAQVMGIAPRTLQRRLQERKIKYQDLLDNVRSGLALDLIRTPNLSLNDIAQYLGFNDQSAFQHAFKRWEGVTPGKYRQNL
jgi:AraC-like DNA-binding protein